jgi:MurNAc alpha-1-phosphate uridylyltransferase
MPDKVFILAAGLGKRLRPYTEHTPKPLVEVNGKTLLDRTLESIAQSNIHTAVINTHYLADKIHTHIKNIKNTKIIISYEPELLDTGGGIKNAVQHFKGEDFFVLSGDGLWINGPSGGALDNLRGAWDSNRMDILILLQPVSSFHLTHGVGDYDILPDGRARRSLSKTGKHMFTSMRINRADIFESAPKKAFSYLELLDKAEANGRLYAIVHDGEWHHISTPGDLEAVDQDFRRRGL